MHLEVQPTQFKFVLISTALRDVAQVPFLPWASTSYLSNENDNYGDFISMT